MPEKVGVGMFARSFMEHFPLLPVEEEGRLHDPRLRENFIERIFAYAALAAEPGRGEGPGAPGGLPHPQQAADPLPQPEALSGDSGRLVARGKDAPAAELLRALPGTADAEALDLQDHGAKNANVLQHAMGYFKKQLSADEKQELLEVIERYRTELVPLVVPVTLLNHYVRKYDEPYLRLQTYLNPHPVELQLRNHV